MNFKLVSKNNIGVVVALLLVILLSQAKVFNFLFETALGRSILVLFVLVLAYLNKILGVVGVLFIIILFNQSGLGYLEGFTSPPATPATATTAPNANATAATATADPNANKEARIAERQKIRQNIKANMAKATPTSTSTPSPTSTPTSTPAAAEGFDIIGTENHIKRGKQSNQIPVSEHMRESMSVSAFDGSFTDYSAF